MAALWHRGRAIPLAWARHPFTLPDGVHYWDLAEIVAGLKPGREREDERTMAADIGLALEDMAVASEIYSRAQERGIGTWLPL